MEIFTSGARQDMLNCAAMPSPPSESAIAAVLALTEALFDSLLDDEPWGRFLDRLKEDVRATHATLILTPQDTRRPAMLLTQGGDAKVSAEYSESLFLEDPFIGLPDGKVCRYRDFVAGLPHLPDDAFNEFIGRIGDEIIGLDLRGLGSFEIRLRASRAPGCPAFAAREIEVLQGLARPLRIAGRLFERLQADKIERHIYSSAADYMALGVIMLDRSGLIMRTNSQAESILVAQDGLMRQGRRLVLADRGQARQLETALRQGEASLILAVQRAESSGPLGFLAYRVNAPDYVAEGDVPAMAVYLSDPGRKAGPPPQWLMGQFGLTAGEALVAAAVADGCSIAEAATRIGIAANTVRAHLRAIYAKTGVNSQAKLAGLIHKSLF